MTIKASSTITPLFKDTMATTQPARLAPPICDFLTADEIQFLHRLWNRTDGNMIEWDEPDLNRFRAGLLNLGYSDELHQEFKKRITSPSLLEKNWLHSALRILGSYYNGLLQNDKAERSALRQSYGEKQRSSQKIIPLHAEIDMPANPEFSRIANELMISSLRINSLIEITNNIKAILERPHTAQIKKFSREEIQP